MMIRDSLNGPIDERRNEDARIGLPMSVENVRWVLTELEGEIKNPKARERRAALFAENARNVCPAGVDLYRQYAGGN